MIYKQVFRRDEKKYLLSPQQKSALLSTIDAQLQPDQYFQSTVSSLYFDTPNHDLIINSISKPIYKQKFRLRSYDTPSLDDDVFLESKIKYHGIVSKRRFKINLRTFYNYLRQGKPAQLVSADSPQIACEMDYLFRFYQLQPAWLIAYDRTSYCGKEHPSLRITFDDNIRGRQDHLRLEQGSKGKNYFSDGTCVMEIKALSAMPLWLVQALSQLKIYPVSFTKYGNIYKQSKKGVLC